MVPITMAHPPPNVEELLKETCCTFELPSDWFQRQLLKSVNFILDTEADSCFPPGSRAYSFQRKPWPYTQYIHRSGTTFVQILPDAQGFLWVNNRLHLSSASSSKGGYSSAPTHELSRDEFSELCGNADKLKALWATLEQRIRDLASEPLQFDKTCSALQ